MKKLSSRTNEKTKESTKDEKKLADKIGPVNRKENKIVHTDPNTQKQLVSGENGNSNP